MKNTQTIAIVLSLAFIMWLIYLLAPILTPFLIAAFLAYITNPLVDYLTKKKVSRTLAAILVFSSLLLILILLLVLLIPILAHQVVVLIEQIPTAFAWVQAQILPWVSQHFGITELFNLQNLNNLLVKHWQTAGNIVNVILKTVTRSGYSLIVFLINLILIPVVTFYLLRDWNILIKGIRGLIPRSAEPTTVKLTKECNEVLGAFFKGQFLVMVSLGIFYSIGLWLVGVKLALLLGIIIGFINIVPYLGSILGLVIGIVAVLIQYGDAMHLIYLAVVFILGHITESMVLTPLLVGDRIGLHPVAVIFAILAGGQLFGFVGVLLALPVAAIIMVLLRHLHKRYLHSKIYAAT